MGSEIVGLIPDAVQQVTIFSAGIATHAANPRGARELIHLLASPAAFPALATASAVFSPAVRLSEWIPRRVYSIKHRNVSLRAGLAGSNSYAPILPSSAPGSWVRMS